MLNKEEKKAIKILQEEHDMMVNPKLEAKYTSDEVKKALEIVFNLVQKQRNKTEKLQKEIEALKKITNTYNSYGGNLMNDTRIIICDSRYFLNGTFVNKFVSKNTIEKYLNSLKYWEDNNTSFLESKGEIFLNKEFIINIFEDLLKES